MKLEYDSDYSGFHRRQYYDDEDSDYGGEYHYDGRSVDSDCESDNMESDEDHNEKKEKWVIPKFKRANFYKNMNEGEGGGGGECGEGTDSEERAGGGSGGVKGAQANNLESDDELFGNLPIPQILEAKKN
jgi:hypothetical protein